MRHHLALITALLFALLFLYAVEFRAPLSTRSTPPLEHQVVIAAPVQIAMYGGDRFLAANLEAIRAATITIDNTDISPTYRLRAHNAVAQLNPCHEDNYYLGNAILTWGGSEEAGNKLLQRATACRFWDEVPPFFYGFNQYFFYRNNAEAQRALEVAASRSTKNAAALRKFAIMIGVEELDDEKMALSYLRDQLNHADDPKLKHMLERRLKRLEGLVALRQAQRLYEQKFKKPLSDPHSLISSEIIQQFPVDPLGIGYEFENGKFRMATLQIQGMRERP